MSHGGAWPGTSPASPIGADRLSRAIARSLLADSIDTLQAGLDAHDDRELEPTRYFLAR